MLSCLSLPKLHNPYLAKPLSIGAYCNASSTTDQHRQGVIAWLDRLQSSMCSACAAGSASSLFRLNMCAAKSAEQWHDSNSEQGFQNHAQPCHASGSQDMIVDLETDPYLGDIVPVGPLASFSISSSRENTGPTADKTRTTGEANAVAENGEIVRLYSFSVALQKGKRVDDGVFLYNFYRAFPATCRARHRISAYANY